MVRKAERLELSMIVMAELLAGFRSGDRLERNLQELEQFLASQFVAVLPVTRSTADRYSRIASRLRQKGKPIPTNDIWIAAHEMESGSDLVTFDGHHQNPQKEPGTS